MLEQLAEAPRFQGAIGGGVAVRPFMTRLEKTLSSALKVRVEVARRDGREHGEKIVGESARDDGARGAALRAAAAARVRKVHDQRHEINAALVRQFAALVTLAVAQQQFVTGRWRRHPSTAPSSSRGGHGAHKEAQRGAHARGLRDAHAQLQEELGQRGRAQRGAQRQRGQREREHAQEGARHGAGEEVVVVGGVVAAVDEDVVRRL